MASLDTLLKTMGLEGEPGWGGWREEMGVTDWERWINLLLVSPPTFSSLHPFLFFECCCACVCVTVHRGLCVFFLFLQTVCV